MYGSYELMWPWSTEFIQKIHIELLALQTVSRG